MSIFSLKTKEQKFWDWFSERFKVVWFFCPLMSASICPPPCRNIIIPMTAVRAPRRASKSDLFMAINSLKHVK